MRPKVPGRSRMELLGKPEFFDLAYAAVVAGMAKTLSDYVRRAVVAQLGRDGFEPPEGLGDEHPGARVQYGKGRK